MDLKESFLKGILFVATQKLRLADVVLQEGELRVLFCMCPTVVAADRPFAQLYLEQKDSKF